MAYITVPHGHDAGRPSGYSAPMLSAGHHSGRHRTSSKRSRGWLVWACVAMAAVGVCIGASIGWATTAQRAAQPMASESMDPDAALWIRSNLGEGAKLLSDGHAPPSGYPVSNIAQPDQDWHAFDYLLTTPGDPPLDGAATAVWRSSVPVAIFPNVQIRRIVPTSPDATLRTREADRADRLLAGTALLSNPKVNPAPQVQTALTEGGLDLRAAAVLTALAGAVTVDVADVEDVPAEAAAGMPARSMTIHVSDIVAATKVLSGMSGAFRADQVISTPDGTIRLHWPLSFAPLPSIK